MNIQQPARNAGQPEAGRAGTAGQAVGAESADVPRFPSSKILGAAGEAVIEHEGHIYRLRRTSRGGLVLTK